MSYDRKAARYQPFSFRARMRTSIRSAILQLISPPSLQSNRLFVVDAAACYLLSTFPYPNASVTQRVPTELRNALS